MSSKAFSYSRPEKLKSRTLLNQIFAEGKSINAFPLKLLYQVIDRKEEVSVKAGVGVSSKHFKKAVDRNRIKRLLRESYRLQKHLLGNTVAENNQLILFFLYTGKEVPDSKIIFEKMQTLLLRISQSFQKQV